MMFRLPLASMRQVEQLRGGLGQHVRRAQILPNSHQASRSHEEITTVLHRLPVPRS
jgi:hypothetical protein